MSSDGIAHALQVAASAVFLVQLMMSRLSLLARCFGTCIANAHGGLHPNNHRDHHLQDNQRPEPERHFEHVCSTAAQAEAFSPILWPAASPVFAAFGYRTVLRGGR